MSNDSKWSVKAFLQCLISKKYYQQNTYHIRLISVFDSFNQFYLAENNLHSLIKKISFDHVCYFSNALFIRSELPFLDVSNEIHSHKQPIFQIIFLNVCNRVSSRNLNNKVTPTPYIFSRLQKTLEEL